MIDLANDSGSPSISGTEGASSTMRAKVAAIAAADSRLGIFTQDQRERLEVIGRRLEETDDDAAQFNVRDQAYLLGLASQCYTLGAFDPGGPLDLASPGWALFETLTAPVGASCADLFAGLARHNLPNPWALGSYGPLLDAAREIPGLFDDAQLERIELIQSSAAPTARQIAEGFGLVTQAIAFAYVTPAASHVNQ